MSAASRTESLAWLRLQLTSGVGPAAVRRLLAAFSLPKHIFRQPYEALLTCVNSKQAQSLLQQPEGFDVAAQTLLAWLERPGCMGISLADAAYPRALLASDDPPYFLYVQCHDAAWWHSLAEPEQAPVVAMVGSRNPTPQGIQHAHQFAQGLSERGFCIASGLALGIDASAHEGALEGRGRTLAVVGTGLATVYPKQHQSLAQRIWDHGGAIVSEYPLHVGPQASHFPKRNRIIAGWALGTVVVEANLKSGSLITARLSMENNRDVFAIPGSIHALQYKGCHALIKQGAKLVECVADIVEELPLKEVQASGGGIEIQAQQTDLFAANEPQHLPEKAKAETKPAVPSTMPPCPIRAEEGKAVDLLQSMGFDPIHLDALLQGFNLSLPELQMQLLQLELQGRVQRLAGGLYQRTQ